MSRILTLTVALSGAFVLATTTGACTKEKSKKRAPAASKTTTNPATTKTPNQPAGQDVKPASGASILKEAAGAYEVDPVHSAAVVSVKHFGVSYLYVRFNKVTGNFKLDTQAEKSTAELHIDVDSLFSANKKRDVHLKSPDFLDAKQFPSIDFKSTAIASAGVNRYKVTGNLTLHGVTKPVTVNLEHVGAGVDPYKKFRTGFEGKVTIKRSDFGMKFMPGAIGDNVRIILAFEGVRS